MGLSGNFRTMGFGDMMQWLASAEKTGALIVDGPKHSKKLYFRQGNVLAAASDNPREMLGYYLVGWGYCAEEDLRHMVEMQDHYGVMLGELVVKMGHMSKAELDQVLMVKTKETLYDLVGWEEGEFRFIDSELPGRDFLEVVLPVTSLLFEGFRQRDERARMAEAVPSSLHVPVVVSQPPPMDGDDQVILSAIDGGRNVEQIALYLRVPEFMVLKFVYKCVGRGFVMVGAPSEPQLIPGKSHAPWLTTAVDINDRLQRGRYLDALKLINGVEQRYRGDVAVRDFVQSMMTELVECMDAEGVEPTGILETTVDISELVNLDCEPAEGFILSRINGQYRLQEVLKQLPGSMVNNRVVIFNLLRRGLVKVSTQRGMAVFKAPEIDAEELETAVEDSDPFQIEA